MKNLGFTVKDPSGYTIEFVQYTPDGWTRRDQGKFLPDTRISEHITHGGVAVTDLAATMHFYGDILGFTESWRGGASSNVLSWINMKVPGEQRLRGIHARSQGRSALLPSGARHGEG